MITRTDNEVKMQQQEPSQVEVQHAAGDKTGPTVFEQQFPVTPQKAERGPLDSVVQDVPYVQSYGYDPNGNPVFLCYSYYPSEAEYSVNPNAYHGNMPPPDGVQYWEGVMTSQFNPGHYVEPTNWPYETTTPQQASAGVYGGAHMGQEEMSEENLGKTDQAMGGIPNQPPHHGDPYWNDLGYQQPPLTGPGYGPIPKPWTSYGSHPTDLYSMHQFNGYYPMNEPYGFNPTYRQNSYYPKNPQRHGHPKNPQHNFQPRNTTNVADKENQQALQSKCFPNQGHSDQGNQNQAQENQANQNQPHPDQGDQNQAQPNQGHPNQGNQNQGQPNQALENQSRGHLKNQQNAGHHRNQTHTYNPRPFYPKTFNQTNQQNNHQQRHPPNGFVVPNQQQNYNYQPRNQNYQYHNQRYQSNNFRGTSPSVSPTFYQRRYHSRYPAPELPLQAQYNYPNLRNIEGSPRSHQPSRRGTSNHQQQQRQQTINTVRDTPSRQTHGPPRRDGSRRNLRSNVSVAQSDSKNGKSEPQHSEQEKNRGAKVLIADASCTARASSPPLEFLQESTCMKDSAVPDELLAIIAKFEGLK